jgi:NOL1/NOP2/fmu family ribosome biogenesis protein
LIYATCSYSREEDTEIVASLLRSGFINKNNSVTTDLFPGIQREENGFTFYPDKIRGEGFFISVLQKEEGNPSAGITAKPWTHTVAGPSEIAVIQPWLLNAEHYRITVVNNIYYAWTETLERAIAASSAIFIQQAGIAIGELKNGQLIPDHALAMSGICASSISKVEVDSDTAIQYLRKNTIQIDVPDKGWHLIAFQGISLGWIKAIPARINNYYPTEWRIRK